MYYLQCSIRYHVNRCSGKITTVDQNVISKSEHSHTGDAAATEVKKAKSKMRQLAATSNSPPRRIIRKITADMSTIAAAEMGLYENLSRNVRRVRQSANTTPKLPASMAELMISGEYTQTIKKSDFLLYDNEDPVNRILIFATKANLKFLSSCDDWYMDGTFDISPPHFKQVYTIHGNSKT